MGRGRPLSWEEVPLPSSSSWFVSSFDICDWTGDIFAIFTKKEEKEEEEEEEEEKEEKEEEENEENEERKDGDEKEKEKGKEEEEKENEEELLPPPPLIPPLEHRFGKLKLREWKSYLRQEGKKKKERGRKGGEEGEEGRRMWSSLELPDLSHQLGDHLSDLQVFFFFILCYFFLILILKLTSFLTHTPPSLTQTHHPQSLFLETINYSSK